MMTDKFKKRVRERQEREGITYSEALRRESTPTKFDAPAPGMVEHRFEIHRDFLEPYFDRQLDELERHVRTTGKEGAITITQIDAVADGSRAFVRVTCASDGAQATDAWLATLTTHIKNMDPDPIGPFEDYSWEAYDD